MSDNTTVICPACKKQIQITDENHCKCGYYYRIKSREQYKIETEKKTKGPI